MPRLPLRPVAATTLAAGLGLGLVAGPAWAATAEIDPDTAPPGGYVRVELAELPPYASVDVTLDGTRLVTLRADEPGTLQTCLQLPHGTAPGEYELAFLPAGDDPVGVPVTVAADAEGATGCLDGPPGGTDNGDESGDDDGGDDGTDAGTDDGAGGGTDGGGGTETGTDSGTDGGATGGGAGGGTGGGGSGLPDTGAASLTALAAGAGLALAGAAVLTARGRRPDSPSPAQPS